MQYKTRMILFLVSALTFVTSYLSAQNSSVISGKVTSEGGEPLPGVVVMTVGGVIP